MGRHLLRELLGGGHRVTALVRAGSEGKLPAGCDWVVGDALQERTFQQHVAGRDTFIQLVGVAHPGPSKARLFREIDLVSAQAGIRTARTASVQHFIYVSVAQPAPVMKPYVAVRAEVEATLRASGMNATILRPWYILGPGHRWPCLLLPAYWICEHFRATRDGARRLGLVTLPQMIASLVYAVENPPAGIRIVEVPAIRDARW